MEETEVLRNILNRIYGKDKGLEAFNRILQVIEKYSVKDKDPSGYFSEDDVVLITYGDSLKKNGEPPLQTLHEFSKKYLSGVVSTIHILPFNPFSSDDGFSVIDFYSVNTELGTWDDIESLGNDFKLMFDLVLNHMSSENIWFKKFLNEEEGFKDFAIVVDPSIDLSEVTRPRSLPLLTEYKKTSGKTVHVWTTFSADQIDINYESLDVLEKMTDVLLEYTKYGAKIIRLDAIAYLWKQIGTNCIHLNETHDIVKCFRKIFDIAAPDVMILTETNVPHNENISYFGNGHDEAQMVYNFTLPPLLFYSFIKEDTTFLSNWAKGLQLESDENTFFNFTASHDGIGVRPLEGILPAEEIDKLIKVVNENEGNVSYKRNPDGSDSPYELNITYIDALLDKKNNFDNYHTSRFLASQAIAMSLPGVPAVYVHSILGSRNWTEGVEQTKRARTINRAKLDFKDIISQLQDPLSFRSRVFFPYIEMIKTRKEQSAFHPNALFEVLDINKKVFAIKRYSKDQNIYALTNISSDIITFSLPDSNDDKIKDLISGKEFSTKNIQLNPYEYLWLS